MVRPALAFLLMLLASLLGTAIPSADAQELSVEFEEVLSIGDDEDGPLESMFRNPEFIETDSEYRIYVVTQRNTIRVFSPDGTYLKTFGRRGRGPGEFLAISAMTMTDQDVLVIYDGRSKRITRFHHVGDSVETQSLEIPDWTGEALVQLGGNRFASYEITSAAYYEVMSQFTDEVVPIDYDDRAVHLLNGTNWKKIESHFDIFEHSSFDPEIPIEAKFAYGRYRLARLNDSTLAVSNWVSDGSLYLLNVNSGEVREVAGHLKGEDSYEILDQDRRRSYSRKRAGIIRSSGGPRMGPVTYQMQLESNALLSNDRGIFHFIQHADGESWQNSIEFLDTNGNYLGYTIIDDDFSINVPRFDEFLGRTVLKQTFYPMHVDDRDRLYYEDWSSGVPVIRVTRIMME